MKKEIVMILLVFKFCQTAMAQQNYPVVGQPLPAVHFPEVQYHEKSSLANSDFKGKWLILYGWNRYCSLCLGKMPLLSHLQENYKDQLNIILVGYNGSRYTKRSDDSAIRSLYERNRIEEKLNLSIAYDSLMFHRFNLGPSPYIIIADPKGVVRYLTSGFNGKQLEEILQGKDVVLKKAYRRDERLNRN
ncbi:TlpA family protein disulfide reductase [Pedobacter sp. SL55]|uniref:TlpA family protein disulfide reductase n=1 Tax=Pedobacter sp. SL55 TaxID=2995161 RepID=UPI00227227FF|nr:redoxin family protein [Pedobacter sp. SL55]WAC42249.1 redoxin domain-containing protein [Pedobacter sp. SL55]